MAASVPSPSSAHSHAPNQSGQPTQSSQPTQPGQPAGSSQPGWSLPSAQPPPSSASHGFRALRLIRLVASIAEARWAGAALVLFVIGALTSLTEAPMWVSFLAYAGCYLTGGWGSAWSGLRALRGGSLDVDLLMVAAAIGAASIGQVFDGALLIVIFATSGALEALATRRTEDSVRALLTFAPERARRLTDDGTAYGEEVVETTALTVGDYVVVRPGERVGADGVVTEGESEIDQAAITGEPAPAPKRTGDEVYAGTLNGAGTLTVRVSRAAEDSVVARIAALVEEASTAKACTQLFIERVEQRYSVTVVAATLALFAVPLLFGANLHDTLLRAMTFMIVASPCAVVLATMPPLLSAIANAGRRGVLVKSAVVMEQLGTVNRVAYDKTGTLTTGRPQVAAVYAVGGHTDREVLAYAAAAETRSEHALGQAIVAAARARGLAIAGARDFRARPGRGVVATVNGATVEVISPATWGRDEPAHAGDAHGVESGKAGIGDVTDASPARSAGDSAESVLVEQLRATVEDGERAGHTIVIVLIGRTPAGAIALADELRADAEPAVAALKHLTGRPAVLLTGDNESAAQALAGRVGIDDIRAGLLPQQKVAAVEEMRASGGQVAVVGDGINDAPALAAAHVGVAMGARGSDLALETADAVVVRDELAAFPKAVALSRRARQVVWQNLVIAGTFIVVLSAWDLLGHLPLPLGVAGHEGSTVIVALNGLRLLRRAEWQRGESGA